MNEYEKEEYCEGDFHLQWFVYRKFTEEENQEQKNMPEFEDQDAGWCKPKTKTEWEAAELCITDGHEIDCPITEYYEWSETGMPHKLYEFLEANGYWIEIKVRIEEPKTLCVSKMGRKKIINVPPKSKLKPGDIVKVYGKSQVTGKTGYTYRKY